MWILRDSKYFSIYESTTVTAGPQSIHSSSLLFFGILMISGIQYAPHIPCFRSSFRQTLGKNALFAPHYAVPMLAQIKFLAAQINSLAINAAFFAMPAIP